MAPKIKAYYRLTKPGIIYGNLLSAIAGFLFASRGQFDAGLFAALVIGTALVIASGCVTNNFIDRDIDKKMARTKKRALANGTISAPAAFAYACVLWIAGFVLLLFFVNPLTALIGLVGFIDYVVFYSISKRRSLWGTLVGSISGATPIVAGYTAVTNQFDTGALLLFLIMASWQMPHFYAIALYRLKDYAAAHLPVLSVVRSATAVKKHILVFIVVFGVAAAALTVFGYAGYSYLAVMILLTLGWLRLAVQGFKTQDEGAWARKVFGFSLLVLLGLSAAISLDYWLP